MMGGIGCSRRRRGLRSYDYGGKNINIFTEGGFRAENILA